jgi:hypothetical protein
VTHGNGSLGVQNHIVDDLLTGSIFSVYWICSWKERTKCEWMGDGREYGRRALTCDIRAVTFEFSSSIYKKDLTVVKRTCVIHPVKNGTVFTCTNNRKVGLEIQAGRKVE